MAFKPNYRFERAERDRQKRAKKEEKAAKRRATQGGDDAAAPVAPDEDTPAETRSSES
jgi:hypothetical protein